MSIAVTKANILSNKQSVREAPLIRAPCNCIGPAWHSSHRKLRSDCGALLWAADGEAPFKAVLATFLSPTLPYFLPVSQTKMTSSCDVKSKKVQLQLHTWCSTVQWKEQSANIFVTISATICCKNLPVVIFVKVITIYFIITHFRATLVRRGIHWGKRHSRREEIFWEGRRHLRGINADKATSMNCGLI